MKWPLTILLTVLLPGCWITGSAAEGINGATNIQTSLVEPPSISRGLSRLQTKGNHIVNGTAEIVRLKGLMIPDPARLAGEGRYARTLFEKVRATGANVIRIPVHPQFWAGDPDYVRHYLEPAVRWAGELGLYVILDWHSIGNELTGYAPRLPSFSVTPMP